MAYVPQTQVLNGVTYSRPPYHRRPPTSGKSFWTIAVNQEHQVFVQAHQANWGDAYNEWGVFIRQNAISFLGKAQDHTTNVFIAKFVGDPNQNGHWHGYPADYQANTQDTPLPEVLQEWVQLGYLSGSKMRKIIKGQPCSL